MGCTPSAQAPPLAAPRRALIGGRAVAGPHWRSGRAARFETPTVGAARIPGEREAVAERSGAVSGPRAVRGAAVAL